MTSAAVLWFFSASLFGLAIVITFGAGVVQMLLLNVRHSAHGGSAPPSIASADFLQFGAAPFRFLAVVLAWFGLGVQAQALFPQPAWFGWLFTLAGFALLPAFTALLALEESLGYALNPARLLQFVRRGGAVYLLLAAALGATLFQGFEQLRAHSFDAEFAAALVFHRPRAATLGWLVAGLYIAMVLAHVLGRIAHTAHDFRPPDGHEVAGPGQPAADSPAVIATAIAARLRRQDREAALHEWKSHAGRDHDFQAALLDALMKERAWGLAPLQAQRAVSAKLAGNRALAALQIAMRMLRDYDSFATVNAQEWLALCRAARQAGHDDWLALLAGRAEGKFATGPHLLDIAILHAQSLADRNDLPAARAALAPCLGWTSHPRHAQLLRLHETLENLQAS